MLYPPFTDIGIVVFAGEDRQKTQEASLFFAERLAVLVSQEYAEQPLRVLGPSPAMIARVNNKFRYRMILKFRNNRRSRELLARLLTEFGQQRPFNDITAYVDIDPDNII